MNIHLRKFSYQINNDIQNCGSIVKVGPFILMLNLLKNNKVLSILFGGMKNSSYFCISKFDKHINGINK